MYASAAKRCAAMSAMFDAPKSAERDARHAADDARRRQRAALRDDILCAIIY